MFGVFRRLCAPKFFSEDGTEEHAAGKRLKIELANEGNAERNVSLFERERGFGAASLKFGHDTEEDVGLPRALVTSVMPSCSSRKDADAAGILEFKLCRDESRPERAIAVYVLFVFGDFLSSESLQGVVCGNGVGGGARHEEVCCPHGEAVANGQDGEEQTPREVRF